MGDAQSAQREGKKDAAAEEESGKVDDAQAEQNIEDKPLKNNGQISEINGKADSSIAEVNGQCEDEIAAEAIISPDEDVSETQKPLREDETPLENIEINEKETPNEADANEDVPLETIEMDAKQNDINEGFRRFFSNIGLKLTVKRGSSEIPTDVPDETNKEEPNKPDDVEDTAKVTKSENAELNTDVNTAQEAYDNDSTTCPTLTDVTSEDVLENAEEKTTETKEEAESDNVEAATTPPPDAHLEATPEKQPHSTSPSSPEEEEIVSPIKRFFTTGIFSGLRKKKKPTEDESTEKELVDMGKKEGMETTVQDQQQDEEEISPGVEAAAVEAENELKEEIRSATSVQTTDEGKSSSTDPSTIIATEPDTSEDKVQASPLKRLLSGSSLKKLSKKQRGRKSSDAKLSDSGEHVSDQLLSSTESAENQKGEGPPQPSAEAAGEEDSAWASFKKLVTPKKRMKRPSLGNEETQISGPVEAKLSEGEQISDHSTEEGKKRKDSSVSWEAVLCGSGRRRSRKTSDSEDETPQIDNNDRKQDSGSKQVAESPLESSTENENEILASSPKQAGSPPEGDGESTWKSLKRLVTPKRKAKDEDESKENIQSDNEVTQDESTFSIKKLLPGRKKRKSAEKQDQISSDEADKDVASGDEDSETPAVVPLSEFDTVETEVHIQTQADIESHIPEEADYELQQHLLDKMTEPVLPCDSLETEAKKVQDDDDLKKQVSPTPSTNDESDDLTESISKHQQLSDIPEEGVITETMATPASMAEEATRDDTIAEDLIEITSEAVTAPEPASDITPADETEMISAVSQLSSESSKTSGNTTPVPAEYDVMETDTLLHNVVETISVSPKAVPVCSEELSSGKIASSVSHQILETLVKEEPTILEIHRKSDATAINTQVYAEELEAINELTATSQTESTSEVIDSVSTELVSEVLTEECDTAEIAVDEVHEVTQESIKELEIIDESHHLAECLPEVDAGVSTDTLPEGEEIIPDVDSLVEAKQAETETPTMDSQEADTAATVADETKDEAMEQEVQTVTEKEDQIVPQPVEVEELQELTGVEKEDISKDIPAGETVTDESKEETMPLPEVNAEQEKEDELDTNAVKTEHVQEPEASEDVQASTIDSEKSGVQLPEAEELQELAAVQAATLDAEEGSVQSPEKEVKTEDIPQEETVADEPKETAEYLPEVSVEPENKELPVDAVQEPEVLEAVQAPILDSGEGSVQSLVKEVISEDVPEAETVTDKSKEEAIKEGISEDVPEEETVTDKSKEEAIKEGISEDVPEEETVTDKSEEEAIPVTEVNLEPVDASKTEPIQESQALEAVQATTLDSEMGSLLPLEKEVTSEDIPVVETVTDEPKQESEPSVVPEEKLPVETVQTEQIQEPEVLSSEVKDIVTETKHEEEALMYMHVVTENIDGGSAQELEKQILLEDIPKPDTSNFNASVTDEIESEVQKIENEVQKIESIPQDVRVEQEDGIPEVLDELPTLTAVHASSAIEEASKVQVLEKTVLSEEPLAPYVDHASVTDEPKHEVNLSAVEVSVEGEKENELLCTEIKTATLEHAVVAQVVVCNLKDVSAAIPDVLIEKTSDVTEPLIDIVTSEQEFKNEVEAAAPLVKDNVAEKAEEGSEVVMMHVPSVAFEDNHRIQVQVVDVEIKSAETIVESVLKVGVTEAKEIIDVCHETVKKVDNLSATPEIEEELINENKVTIQEVIQHVKEGLPETVPESVVVSLEKEVIKQPDAVTEVSEVVESESNEVEDQKAMEDSIGSFRERQDEVPDVISDDSVTEQQVSKDLMQTPGSLEVSIRDHEEDLEETKAEQEKSEVVVAEEEVKLSSEELDVKKINEQAQITQIAQSQVVTPTNTGLVVPQNTGIISSIGNVESPSSLSLEFKLNIQFGQARAPASPPPTTERTAPVKQTDVSDVGVQAVEIVEPIKPINTTQTTESQKQTDVSDVGAQAIEAVVPIQPINTTQTAESQKQTDVSDVGAQAIEAVVPIQPINTTQTAESQKQTEMSDVGAQAIEAVEPIQPIHTTQTAESQKQTELTQVSVQATEITEPAANLDSTERAVITTPPVLLDVGIHALETAEPVEQVKSTERVTSIVQAAETIEPIRPTGKIEALLSPPAVSEARVQETKTEEPVKQVEEENDQDVWMDAEEVIYTQEETEKLLLEVEEHLVPQTESEQQEKEGLGHEIGMTSQSKTEEEESQQEMHKTGGTCEIESDGEDFAVAPEHLETATVSVTTAEWD